MSTYPPVVVVPDLVHDSVVAPVDMFSMVVLCAGRRSCLIGGIHVERKGTGKDGTKHGGVVAEDGAIAGLVSVVVGFGVSLSPGRVGQDLLVNGRLGASRTWSAMSCSFLLVRGQLSPFCRFSR